jgi:hypothetical protein
MPSVFSRHRALERVFNDLFPNLARKRDSGEDILDQKFHRFPVFIGLDHSAGGQTARRPGSTDLSRASASESNERDQSSTRPCLPSSDRTERNGSVRAFGLKLPRRSLGLGRYSPSRVYRTHPNRAGHTQHNLLITGSHVRDDPPQ